MDVPREQNILGMLEFVHKWNTPDHVRSYVKISFVTKSHS